MPNEATNFREAVAENFRDVFLGQGHAEEWVSYAHVGESLRQVLVRVIEARAVHRDDTNHRIREFVVRLLVERDAENGIADPREGDVLFRGTGEDLGPAYDFREIEEEDVIGNSHVLRFASTQVMQAGPRVSSRGDW